jgi:hypothetical protein
LIGSYPPLIGGIDGYILFVEYSQICIRDLLKSKGGNDKYNNLMLIDSEIHVLVHATTEKTIKYYKEMLNLNSESIRKINELRKMIGCEPI